jgi:Na+/melibiose symporter-like transporter
VFALVGAVYIATRSFPAAMAATLIGATQMFGMAGGSAGQFVVGPLIASGVPWGSFWVGMGVAGLVIGAVLFRLIPGEDSTPSGPWVRGALAAMGAVFRNPQSILCGVIAGLLFIPTTIFDMVWGVRYLQEARGVDYATAVMRSATVPVGWIIGCPLLGFLSDRLGRRKPVIVGGALVLLGCMALILYGPPGLLPPYVVGLVAGIASGAAMLPYTVIKEANPPAYSGTATGVVNFLNFTFSAVLGPVFGSAMRRAAEGPAPASLETYQVAFAPLLYGIALALVLTFFLRETGPAAAGPVSERHAA